MSRSVIAPPWQRALIVLSNTVVFVTIVAVLYFAKTVLIPIALAMFLTFLLTPLVKRVERLHVGRVVSVVIVVGCVSILFALIVWVSVGQISSLAGDLPMHTENIRDRIREIRKMSEGPTTARLGWMFNEISKELNAPTTDTEPTDNQTDSEEAKEKPVLTRGESEPRSPEGESEPDTPEDESESAPAGTEAEPVVVRTESPSWRERAPYIFGQLMESVVSFGLALVLVIFTLLRREALRNRFIWVVGDGRMSATTKAVDEAGERISRFLFMQFIINATYGLAWGTGLYFIGVAYAPLWGFLGFILRYIPYVGSTLAAILPIIMSFAQFTGWWEPLTVIGLLIVLELASNNIMEPLLYGKSIGVSEVAMIVSAAFWTLLWGPIGLVLSAPLTVCLVVMGRHVSRLETLVVLMSDEPALAKHVSFYQRLLARDYDEAEDLLLVEEKQQRGSSIDTLIIPALTYLKRDRAMHELTDDDETAVLDAVRELAEQIEELKKTDEETPPGEPTLPRVQVLACPARDEEDRLAVNLLSIALDDGKWEVDTLSSETLASELVARVAENSAQLICIAALPPGGLAHTRYLCKRLKARAPDVKILVGRWGARGNPEAVVEQLREAGADFVASTVAETIGQLEAWLPIMARVKPRPVVASVG